MSALISLAYRVRETIQPDARATAMAATLEQLATITPDATAAALAAGFRAVSVVDPTDGPREIARRNTCRELVNLLGVEPSIAPDLDGARDVWSAWARHFEASPDPRHMAMAQTFRREIVEMDGLIF